MAFTRVTSSKEINTPQEGWRPAPVWRRTKTGVCVGDSLSLIAKIFKKEVNSGNNLFSLHIKIRENRENPQVWFGKALLDPKQ